MIRREELTDREARRLERTHGIPRSACYDRLYLKYKDGSFLVMSDFAQATRYRPLSMVDRTLNFAADYGCAVALAGVPVVAAATYLAYRFL